MWIYVQEKLSFICPQKKFSIGLYHRRDLLTHLQKSMCGKILFLQIFSRRIYR